MKSAHLLILNIVVWVVGGVTSIELDKAVIMIGPIAVTVVVIAVLGFSGKIKDNE